MSRGSEEVPQARDPASPPGAARRRLLLPLLVFFAATAWFAHPLVYGPVPDGTGGVQWRFHNLLFDSHERLHYVIRLSELHDALTHGQWIVRWARNLEGGYGYPFFNFYAPLSYYLAEFWHLAGLDLFMAWKAHFFLMAFLSAWGAFLYARLFCGPAASTVAGLLYLLAPYHILNLYVRGNVAEFTAMTVLPFLVYYTHRLLRSSTDRSALAGTAASAAALILTHNLTGFFGGLFVAGYCLAWAAVRRRFALLRVPVWAGLCGVLLSAFFWLPAALEMKHVQIGSMQHTFRETPQHIVAWWQYFVGRWGFGDSVPGTADRMTFVLGWPQWALFAGGVIAALRTRRPAGEGNTAVLILGGALLLLLALASFPFVWRLPGFSALQFPWRLLAVASFCMVLPAAWSIELLSGRNRRLGSAAVVLSLAVTAAATAPKLRVQGYFPNEPGMYRPENTRNHFTSTNIGEFRPVWVRHLPQRDGETPLSRRRILNAGSGTTVRQISPDVMTDFEFTHRGGGPLAGEKLLYEVFYFPGWKLEVDGKPQPLRPQPGTGRIMFTARPGEHRYRLWLGLSPAQTAGTLLSLVGAVLLAMSAFCCLRRSGHTP